MASNFCTISYDVRDKLGITNNQYIVCDIANRMSQRDGWTSLKRDTYADKVGVSERALIELLKVVIDKGLIERHPTRFEFKATKKWVKEAVEIEMGEESSRKKRVKKVHAKGEESSPDKVKKVHAKGEESSHHIEEKKRKSKEEKKRESKDAQAQKIIFDLEEKEKEKDVFSAPPKSPKTVIVDVIDYLNLKCEKSYKHTTKKTQMLVLNILKDFSIEEIKEVIDFKSKEWKNDLNMNQYLRPETILGNKFESYLQSSKSIKNGKFNNDKGIIANSTTTNPRQRDYTAFKNQINDLCENGLRDRDGSKESVIDIEHEDLSIDQLFDRAFGIGAG